MNNTVENKLGTEDLSNLGYSELLSQAQALGAEIKDGADEADLISAIIEKQMSMSAAHEATPGYLIGITTKDEAAKEFVRKARDAVLVAEGQRRNFKLLLKNKSGHFYNRTEAAVRVSSETMQTVMQWVTPLQDGVQDVLVEKYKTNPELFQQPMLVNVNRRVGENPNGSPRFQNFVMLYLREKQNTPEQVL